MRIIYKYEIPLTDEFTLDLPSHSEILCVQVQNDKPYIWVSCDHDTCHPCYRKRFYLRGTGFPFDYKSNTEKYIGTFQLNWYVGHLFEE